MAARTRSLPDSVVEQGGQEYHIHGVNHGHRYVHEPSRDVKKAIQGEVDRASRDGIAYLEEGTASLLRPDQLKSSRVRELDDLRWMAQQMQSPIPLDRFDRFVLSYTVRGLAEATASKLVKKLPETSSSYIEQLRTKELSRLDPDYLEDLVAAAEEGPLPFDIRPEGEVRRVFESGRNMYIAAETAYHSRQEGIDEAHIFTGASRMPGVRIALQEVSDQLEDVYDDIVNGDHQLP